MERRLAKFIVILASILYLFPFLVGYNGCVKEQPTTQTKPYEFSTNLSEQESLQKVIDETEFYIRTRYAENVENYSVLPVYSFDLKPEYFVVDIALKTPIYWSDAKFNSNKTYFVSNLHTIVRNYKDYCYIEFPYLKNFAPNKSPYLGFGYQDKTLLYGNGNYGYYDGQKRYKFFSFLEKELTTKVLCETFLSYEFYKNEFACDIIVSSKQCKTIVEKSRSKTSFLERLEGKEYKY